MPKAFQTQNIKLRSYRRFLDFLLIRKAKRAIGAENLQALQRFNLFRTFSLIVFLIGFMLCAQILSIFGNFDFVTTAVTVLTVLIAVNYFLLNYHKNFRFSYWIIISASLLVLHIVSYYSGGIRNSGMMYLGGLILTTFMLLGNREGKIVSFVIVVNLIYFYFITNAYGEHVRNILDTDAEGHMLNLDYVLSYTAGILLIYGLSNNLESSKNIVIANVMQSKIILEQQNEELKKLSLVASNTDNAVVITNQLGIVDWVNEGFTRLTGYGFDEIVGKRTNVLHGPMTDPATTELIRERIRDGQSFSGELQKMRKDGKPLWMQVTITPIFDEQKQISKFIQVESDITERKIAEGKMAEYYQYLEKANKELDKFAYVVSHDLKAPLRAIANLSTWIEEDIGERFTPETSEHFKMLRGRVVRMEGLINGILEYSRADRVKSPHSKVDVAELIKETIEVAAIEADVHFTVPDKLPVLMTERMKLEQVFSNLISNAIKHNDKEKTEIIITCEELNDAYLFGVEDNGPGIDAQYHEKVFVIFQTLQARDSFESTGVGLAIVKKIVDEIGGRIWIESAPGNYARFMFQWPKVCNQGFKPFQFSIQDKSTGGQQGAVSSVA
jgi:PAS domain S-box-containing protein